VTPRCTIITPCFNDGVFLEELRRSIELGEMVEHVIVDDGSTDPVTLEILASLEKGPGVTVLRTLRSGPASARNLAIRSVETPYAMPVDADDTIMPGAIRDLADALDADPGLSVVWGDTVIFGTRLAKVPCAADLDPWWFTFVNDVVVGLMGRTEVLAQAGWDETSEYEDWGTTLSLIGAGARGRNVGRVTYGYRSHTQARRRNEAEKRDEEEIENLRTRYRWIFRQRRELRRRSSAPFGVRVIGTVVAGIPGLSDSSQNRWVNRLSRYVWRRRWIHHPGDLPCHPLRMRFRSDRPAHASGPLVLGVRDVVPSATHVVIVSPHCDDAVLSAFALLDDPGLTVEVVNVFTEPTESADWIDRVGAVSAVQEAEERQREDQCALGGRAVVVDLGCGPRISEDDLRARLGRALEASRQAHGAGLLVAAPAGAGLMTAAPRLHGVGPVARLLGTATSLRHRDHLIVRDAVLRWAAAHPDVCAIVFDDFPYHWAKSALRSADPDGAFHLPVDTTAKAAAIRCYASQMEALFTTEQRAHLEGWLPPVEAYSRPDLGHCGPTM